MNESSLRHILLVEDDPAIAEPLSYALGREGWQVHWRTLASEAMIALESQAMDFIILDVGLPDANGFDLCRHIRQRCDTPLLFLTARNEEVERIIGLEIGADDYCSKPFSPRELVSRVRAIWRRSQPVTISTELAAAKTGHSRGPWQWDHDRLQIHYHGVLLNLTRHEYRLLQTLLGQPERVWSRSRLMQAAWENPDHSLERTVDTHIKTLRHKLREAGGGLDPIITHRGIGYSISAN